MPKVGVIKASVTETFLTDKQTVVGDAYSQYTCSPRLEIIDPKLIKERLAKASPRELEQINLFIKANTERKYCYEYWKLTTYTNLDTGRKFLTAACSLEPLGLSAEEFRKILGLVPYTEPETATRRAVVGGGKRKLK